MKKIFVFTILSIASFAIMSQNIIQPQEVIMKKTLEKNYNFLKIPTDTICLNEFFNLGQATIYGYNPYGYIFGTGWGSDNTPKAPEIAQGYVMTFSGGYNIEEALIWVADKSKISANGSSINVKVSKIDGTSQYSGSSGSFTISCPNTVLTSTTVSWTDIDTTDFTVVPFSTPVYVTSDYAIVVNFDNFYSNNDTIGIVCSADGGGSAINGIEYTWWKYRPTSGNPFWAQLSHIFTSSGGAPIDVCIAIFPVVDANAGIVDGSSNFINGLQLGQNSPNPAITGTIIPYAVEKTSEIKLEIYDVRGNLIRTINEGIKTSGSYTINLNDKLVPGTYYYSIVAGKNRLTKKMIFSK